MAQGKLINVENVKNGIRLTFLDLENNKVSGIYNNGNLNEEQLRKLIGQHISFLDNKQNDNVAIHKAWTKSGTPIYCDDEKHGFDR